MKVKSLIILAAIAILTMLIGQEIRFDYKLDALRAERAADAAGDASASPGAASSEATEEAVRQMSRARAELAAAQQRLSSAVAQIQQLQSQMQTLGTREFEGRLTRPRFGPLETDFIPGSTALAQGRSWGQEQATGAPDTHQAGDIPSAWAPRQQDGGEEWLHLDYSNHVQLAEVRVRETYNPGAISKVAAILPNGQEVTLWEGVDDPSVAPIDKSFSVQGNITAKSVKVYLDTRRVPGWNEIDAVELVGRDGTRQWASHANASSSFADPR